MSLPLRKIVGPLWIPEYRQIMPALKDDEESVRPASQAGLRPLLDHFDRFHLFLLYGVWQRGIVQLRDHALAFLQHPAQEVDNSLLFGCVLPLLRD